MVTRGEGIFGLGEMKGSDGEDVLDLNDRWVRYLKEDDRFWKVCLKVARAKPHLCAEEVEAEATLIVLGLRPEPE